MAPIARQVATELRAGSGWSLRWRERPVTTDSPPADALEQAGQQVHPSTVACAAATRLGAPDILDSGQRMGTLAGLVATAGCPGILWRGRVELEALDDRHALSDALIERRRR
jgi:hypothetical protein